MSAVGHRVPIDLGLDVDNLLRVGLEPCNVNLNVKVPNAMIGPLTFRKREETTGSWERTCRRWRLPA
jgi:hypothetical protein